MNCYKLILPDEKSLRRFIAIVRSYPCEVEVQQGDTAVDGKSAMAMLTLDYSRPMAVQIKGDKAKALECELGDLLNRIQ